MRELEVETGLPLTLHYYAAPPGKRVLDLHYDAHDVTIIQLVGERRYTHCTRLTALEEDGAATRSCADYYDEHVPLSRGASLNASDFTWTDDHQCGSQHLRAGDALRMVQGIVHRAQPVGDIPSVHLTVSVRKC